MDRIFKLTDQSCQTHGGFAWRLRRWYSAPGTGDLCSAGWLHAYDGADEFAGPLLAILFNPIHANFPKPRLFQGRGAGAMLEDRGLKRGYSRLILDREIEVPAISQTQRIAFGIICAKQVYADHAWTAWADAWLSGKNRTKRAACATAAAARAVRAAHHLDFPGLARQAMQVPA